MRRALPRAMGGARVGGPDRDCWRTPPELFEPLHEELRFSLDAAATEASALLPHAYCIDRGENGLAKPWSGRVFCNPPFSKLVQWVNWARIQALFCDVVVMLVPARPETAWFRGLTRPPDDAAGRACIGTLGSFSFCGWAWGHGWQEPAVEVRFLSPRVRYLRSDGTPAGSPAFGSAVVILRRVPR